jgi:hypothetical protein
MVANKKLGIALAFDDAKSPILECNTKLIDRRMMGFEGARFSSVK